MSTRIGFVLEHPGTREAAPMVYLDDNAIKTYFQTYVEAYGEAVKAAGKAGQEPDFYKAIPFKVDIFKMPNEAVIAVMYGKAPKAMYTIYDGDWDQVKDFLSAKAHQQAMLLYPTKNFSTDDAKADAKTAVSRDTRATVYRAGLVAARTHVEDIGKQLAEIAKANPWLEKQLKDLEQKLLKAKAPLDKLWEEYKKVDEQEVFSDQEMTLHELKAVGPSSDWAVDARKVEEYLKTYIETYRSAIKPEYPDHAKPPFYKGAPYKIRANIMPNRSVAVLFKYGAVVDAFESAEDSYDNVKALIENKAYDGLLHFPPLKAYTEKRASTEAKLRVKEDIRNTLHLALLKSTAKVISDHQEKIKEIMKTNPWLEGPLSSISNRLSGVAKLLEVLTGEIEGNQLNIKPADQKRLLQEVSRYKAPKKGAEPAAEQDYSTPVVEYTPSEPVVARAEVVSQPSSSGPVFLPAPSPPSAIAGETTDEAFPPDPLGHTYDMSPPPQQEPHYVAPAGMTEDERAQMNEVRAEVFEFRKRIDEFERKINYMDNYIETQVQKRQDDKFKEQEEVYTSMIRKYSGVATGLGIAAMVISLLVLVTNIGSIMSALGGLFG